MVFAMMGICMMGKTIKIVAHKEVFYKVLSYGKNVIIKIDHGINQFKHRE